MLCSKYQGDSRTLAALQRDSRHEKLREMAVLCKVLKNLAVQRRSCRHIFHVPHNSTGLEINKEKRKIE
jgi:hypothetical protein